MALESWSVIGSDHFFRSPPAIPKPTKAIPTNEQWDLFSLSCYKSMGLLTRYYSIQRIYAGFPTGLLYPMATNTSLK